MLVWALAFALECATIVAAIKFYSYLVFILPVCAMLTAMAVSDLAEHRRSPVAAACVFTVFSFRVKDRHIRRPWDEAEVIGGTGKFIGENTDFYDPIAVGNVNPAYINMVLHVPDVRDYTCGCRLYTRRALLRAREKYGGRLIERQSFACMMELLYKLHKSGARFAEVPFRLCYDDKQGESKMRIAKTIKDSLLTALALRFSA